jgi:hypothetical protein
MVYAQYPFELGGGVTTINGLTGAVTLVGGTDISVAVAGQNITIAFTGAGLFANTALSNLAAVAINTSLLPGADNSIDLGSLTLGFRNTFMDGYTQYTAIATPSAPAAGHKLIYATTESTQTVMAGLGPTGNQVIMFQDILTPAFNASGGTITRGQAVIQSGESGGTPAFILAEANSGTGAQVYGLVLTTSIASGAIGEVLSQGKLTGVNTSAFNAGDTLYLSDTVPGGLQNFPPVYPSFVTKIGVVLVADATVGVISLQIIPAVILPVIASPVGFYYWAIASADIAGYDQMNTAPSTAATVIFTSTGSTSKTLMEAFATPIGSPDTTSIPAGSWLFTIFAKASSAAGTNTVTVDVYQRSQPGGVETLLFTVVTPQLTATLAEYDVLYTSGAITLLATDRLVFKVSGTSSVAAHTISFYTQDTSNNSFVSTPLAAGTGATTSISVATANGFAGTSSGGTTPVLTLSTTLTTPVVAANGTALIAGTTTGTGSTVMLNAGPTFTGTMGGGALTLTTALAVTSGGTGQNSALTQWGSIYAASATAMASTAAGTTGQVLTAATGGAPTWSTNPSGAAISIGALDAQAENAKGLALVSGVLSAQSADATHPGMVNNTTQTLGGAKTFNAYMGIGIAAVNTTGLLVSAEAAGVGAGTEVAFRDISTYTPSGGTGISFFSTPTVATNTVALIYHYNAVNTVVSSGALTREVGFLYGTPGSTQAVTGMAVVTDNVVFTGNWFINQVSTLPSLFSGPVTAGASGTSLAVTSNATVGGTLTVTGLLTASADLAVTGNIIDTGAGGPPYLQLVNNQTGGVNYSLYSANSASNGFNGFGILDSSSTYVFKIIAGTGAATFSGPLTVTGATTLNGSSTTNNGAEFLAGGVADFGKTYVTSAGNFTIANNVWHVIVNAGTQTTLTITMPAVANNGQIVTISFVGAITTLSVVANTGQTLDGTPTTAALNAFATWIYNTSTTTWYRCG